MIHTETFKVEHGMIFLATAMDAALLYFESNACKHILKPGSEETFGELFRDFNDTELKDN